MNWKRIWSGAFAAAAAMIAIDAIAMLIQYLVFKWFAGLSFLTVFLAVLGYLIDGFFCAWLYAVMRPRMGPGPKTAMVTGTAIFFIKQGLGLFISGRGGLWLLILWFRLLVASYLAGWQYIEKAP